MDAGSYFFSANPSPLCQRGQFGGADPLDQPVEVLADPRLRPGAVDVDSSRTSSALLNSLRAESRWPSSKFRLAGLEVPIGERRSGRRRGPTTS